MPLASYLLFCIALFSSFTPGILAQATAPAADPKELTQTILKLDSAFWRAYNACDVDAMKLYFTDDIEFYHDKGGLTTPLSKLIESMKEGLCGNANFRLRREAVEGTVKVFPLNNYGAIISGEHVFYINEGGKKGWMDWLNSPTSGNLRTTNGKCPVSSVTITARLLIRITERK